MTSPSIAKSEGFQKTNVDSAAFIKELLGLRAKAEQLDMSRVALCLDYAYWETISSNRRPQPFDDAD